MTGSRHKAQTIKKLNPLSHKIEFKTKNPILHIELKTKRLIIRSITSDDEKDYMHLLADPSVMEKYAEGKPYDENKSKEFLKMWIDRWKNHNPYSGYAIFEKKSNKFIGTISIRNSEAGVCKAAYIFHHDVWGNGFGTETSQAVFSVLIPRLMLRGYASNGLSLKKIIATARLDNAASMKILLGAGFKEEGLIHEHGDWRNIYCLFANTIKNRYHHFYNRQDRKLRYIEHKKMKNTGVSITEEQMADSPFGQWRRK